MLFLIARSATHIHLESTDHRGSVRLDLDGKTKHWLVMAFAKTRRVAGALKQK